MAKEPYRQSLWSTWSFVISEALLRVSQANIPVPQSTYSIWNEYLSRFEIEGQDEFIHS